MLLYREQKTYDEGMDGQFWSSPFQKWCPNSLIVK